MTIYGFGFNSKMPIGDSSQKDLLGGKGANLGHMSRMGLPVPPGITIPTTYCQQWLALDPKHQPSFVHHLYMDSVKPALDALQEQHGFCLFSVRSGAADSMPGMMNTLLNVGITTKNFPTVEQALGWTAAHDCRRRQFEMYADVVLDANELVDTLKAQVASSKYGEKALPADIYQSVPHLLKLIEKYEHNVNMPDDFDNQMIRSIRAVFQSWNSERAREYRAMHGIDDNLGTAVTIQSMVYGNLNKKSASGVYFTRNPMTGENIPYGDFVVGGQGEDVVAGTHDTLALDFLQEFNPTAYAQLIEFGEKLEGDFEDMVDIEFTIENGKLYMLQVRVGKREARAAFRIAHDFAEEGVVSREQACKMVTVKQFRAMRKTRIDLDVVPDADFIGIAAGGSLVVGRPVYSSAEAKALGGKEPVILVTDETNPEDFGGMAASVGILTRTGGQTSHAAVVGRSLEKHCVVGCTSLPEEIAVGQITIDGSTGRVWFNALPLVSDAGDEYAAKLLEWGSEGKILRVGIDYTGDLNGKCVTLADAVPADVAAFLGTLAAKTFEKIYIDLTVPGSEMREDDALLWELTGQVRNPAREALQARVHVFAEVAGSLGLLDRVLLLAAPEASGALLSAGWKVVAVVDTLDRLLDSTGVVDILPAFAASVGGEEVAAKLINLMAEAGKQIEQVPDMLSHARLISTVFAS
jgi:pyruvate,orthophosphate dikinase